VSTEASLEQWLTTLPSLTSGENKFGITFDWEVEKVGLPGAIIVKNNHATEFFLKTITLDDVPGHGKVVFMANSWVYPQFKYRYNRVFFTNDVSDPASTPAFQCRPLIRNNAWMQTYLPSQMPATLKPYREDELRNLRGDDQQGPYQAHDRVYRYDVYNDLGNPDSGKARPTLGGSKDHPYPRRGRTGRKSTLSDPDAERRLTLLDQDVYVPRDERFGHVKQSDFLGYSIKALADAILPAIQTYVDLTPGEFDSFEDVLKLYEGGIKLPNIPALEEFRKQFPFQLVKDLMPSFSGSGDVLLKLPMPKIIKEDRRGWMTDDEFAREILAGVNPLIIRRLTVSSIYLPNDPCMHDVNQLLLPARITNSTYACFHLRQINQQEFPPKSTLDPAKFGDHTSTITEEHTLKNLHGLTVAEALDSNRLYILDHHDHYMPFLIDINSLDDNFIYATRTLFFLRGNGTLTPVAIELSLPDLRDGVTASKSAVYTPVSGDGAEAWVWHLAKAFVNVNDYCWHQGVSHWLNTHAVMEPFVIATNRHLSVTHPVNKLLLPHYRDTMNINALARQKLISAGGIFEMTVFPRKYALEITSKVYAGWNLNDQALPNDLIKRYSTY
jgi:linoleate 9S-lipoxygenase